MAFNITLTDGTLLTKVEDGTINDASCSLTLIGKNYVGYGTIYNDNLVHLLENFSNDTAPENPLEGQLWWDKSGNLNVYTGEQTGFKTISTVTSSSTRPTDAAIGASWWDTANNQLYVWDGTTWVLVGPAISSEVGQTGLVTEQIRDSNDVIHFISTMYVNSQIVGIYSKDQEFTPEPSKSGFVTIKPGLNFISNAVISDIGMWGSASQLGGIDSSFYARTDINETFDYDVTVVGNLIANGTSTFSNLDVSLINVSGDISTNGNINSNGNITANYFLGNGALLTGVTSYSNANVSSYLPIYTGNLVSLTGNVRTTANVTAENIIANINLEATKAIISSNITAGNIITTVISTGAAATAGTFTGTWSLTSGSKLNATYADLAEMFTSDQRYEPGTVVKIGGEYEVTQENEPASNNVFGVVSSQPAYVMNAFLPNSIPIALSGKVPIKVTGIVSKGDRLISAGNGVARAAGIKNGVNEITAFNIIGRSLEHKETEEEGTVLAFVAINK